jgi:hypothetical protein
LVEVEVGQYLVEVEGSQYMVEAWRLTVYTKWHLIILL